MNRVQAPFSLARARYINRNLWASLELKFGSCLFIIYLTAYGECFDRKVFLEDASDGAQCGWLARERRVVKCLFQSSVTVISSAGRRQVVKPGARRLVCPFSSRSPFHLSYGNWISPPAIQHSELELKVFVSHRVSSSRASIFSQFRVYLRARIGGVAACSKLDSICCFAALSRLTRLIRRKHSKSSERTRRTNTSAPGIIDGALSYRI